MYCVRKEIILEDFHKSEVTRKVNDLLHRKSGLRVVEISNILKYSKRGVRFALKHLEDIGKVKGVRDITVDARHVRYYLIRGN